MAVYDAPPENVDLNVRGEDMVATRKFHYGWLIFAAICIFSGTALGLTINIASVYMLPVSSALGVSRSEFMLWLTIYAIFMAATNPIWGNLLQKRNVNIVTTIGLCFVLAGILTFAFSSNVMMIYIGGALIGCGLPALTSLLHSVLSVNWFAENKRGKLLGISSAFSGAGTFIWAPLFTLIMSMTSYQMAYLISAAILAVLGLPFTIKLIKFKPADVGLQPLGYDPETATSDNSSLNLGVSAGKAMKTWPFWLLLFIFAVFSLGMGFNSNQNGIATEFLAGSMDAEQVAMIGAWMVSTAAITNMLGKIVFGAMLDKFGLKPTNTLFLILFFGAFVVWAAFHNVPGLFVGAALLGTHNAFMQVGCPLLVRELYGPREYSKILSYLLTSKTLMGGFTATIIAFVYDSLGSYQQALYFGIAIVVVCAIVLFACMSQIGKFTWTDGSEKATEPAA